MTTQEMIRKQDHYASKLLSFVCGKCAGTPEWAELLIEGPRWMWSIECCGKKGRGQLSDRQRNLLAIGRPVQIQGIVGEDYV